MTYEQEFIALQGNFSNEEYGPEFLVLPDRTRFTQWDFATVRRLINSNRTPFRYVASQRYRNACNALEMVTGLSSYYVNSPDLADGILHVDGHLYEYIGADCRCSEDDIAHAIRWHVVSWWYDEDWCNCADGIQRIRNRRTGEARVNERQKFASV